MLCIQLVRFGTTMMANGAKPFKNTSDVIMPIRGLDAADISRSYEPGTRLYDLVAVCNHTGGSVHSGALHVFVTCIIIIPIPHAGHYTASVLHGEQWYLYNDGAVPHRISAEALYMYRYSTN